MKTFILIVTLEMNPIFHPYVFLPQESWKWICWISSWIRILFQWNDGCCLFFRCGYSTMNHAMWYTLLPIIIVLLIILLNYYIMMILLTVVLYRRLWLIIRLIVLSTSFPITIWYCFTEFFYIWNYYILANGWQMTTYWWPGTNNFIRILF